MLRLAGALVVMASLLVATPSHARRTDWIYDKTYRTERPLQLDLTAFAWPFGGVTRFGGAVWLDYPILESGVIPLNDVLYIEAGAFFAWLHHDIGETAFDFFAIGPVGGVRWGLDLTEDWQVFLTAKAGWRIGIGEDIADNALLLSFSIGAIWELSKAMHLRLETGNYGIAMIGLCFPF